MQEAITGTPGDRQGVVRSLIPARIDRLPWSPFHTRMVITLGVYLVGSGLTAFTAGNNASWIVYLYITRFIAGMGIGGEYAAINLAIDELIPARFRGRVDIAINGTYWAGAILGTLGAKLPVCAWFACPVWS